MAHTLSPEGTLTSAGELRVTGIHSGLKSTRDRDLGLVVARTACTAAGYFGAASGSAGAWSTARLRRGSAEDVRALLLLSGCAGARGAQAITDYDALAQLLADEAVIKPEQVLILAAGPEDALPMELLRVGVSRALDELDSGGGRRLALAMVADEQETPTQAALELHLGGTDFIIGGVNVGGAAGRTLLATNAAIASKPLQQAVDALLATRPDLDQGALVLLANATAGALPNTQAQQAWQAALQELVAHLLPPA